VALRDLFRNPFSFLTARSSKSERVTAYILREHDRGRPLADILNDPYISNRCNPNELGRLLERPELIHALGEDVVAAAQDQLT
jgi:hypothetical protein